jgi:hypothetical protein
MAGFVGYLIKAIIKSYGADTFVLRGRAIDDYIIHGWRDIDGIFWNGIADFSPAAYAWIQPDITLEMKSYWRLPISRFAATEISIGEA